MKAFYSLSIGSVLDVYVRLEGNWNVDFGTSGSLQYHSSLNMAKRYCTNTENCFGIREISGDVLSIEFPVQLRQQGVWYIHKKANISGNFHLSIIF